MFNAHSFIYYIVNCRESLEALYFLSIFRSMIEINNFFKILSLNLLCIPHHFLRLVFLSQIGTCSSYFLALVCVIRGALPILWHSLVSLFSWLHTSPSFHFSLSPESLTFRNGQNTYEYG